MVLKFSKEDRETLTVSFSDDKQSIKALGIVWCPLTDVFQINLPAPFGFDPLGLIGPITSSVKIFMQQLWGENLKWDDPLSSESERVWAALTKNLCSLKEINIPRHLFPIDNPAIIELHGFSDASMEAYGAVCYIVVCDTLGNRFCNLVTSKSRVAPLKTITLARFELSAAVLLAKLVHKINDILNISSNKTILWTDSMIVLSWLNSHPSKRGVFVANRISTFQEFTPNHTGVMFHLLLTLLTYCHMVRIPFNCKIVRYGEKALNFSLCMNTIGR